LASRRRTQGGYRVSVPRSLCPPAVEPGCPYGGSGAVDALPVPPRTRGSTCPESDEVTAYQGSLIGVGVGECSEDMTGM
jgi:hypothetical protein